VLHLMISLCPGGDAKVGRTKVVLSQVPRLLLELWCEQHPLGQEQTALDFKANFPAAKRVPLFREIREFSGRTGHKRAFSLLDNTRRPSPQGPLDSKSPTGRDGTRLDPYVACQQL
jgi:hypothetical protein